MSNICWHNISKRVVHKILKHSLCFISKRTVKRRLSYSVLSDELHFLNHFSRAEKRPNTSHLEKKVLFADASKTEIYGNNRRTVYVRAIQLAAQGPHVTQNQALRGQASGPTCLLRENLNQLNSTPCFH